MNSSQFTRCIEAKLIKIGREASPQVSINPSARDPCGVKHGTPKLRVLQLGLERCTRLRSAEVYKGSGGDDMPVSPVGDGMALHDEVQSGLQLRGPAESSLTIHVLRKLNWREE